MPPHQYSRGEYFVLGLSVFVFIFICVHGVIAGWKTPLGWDKQELLGTTFVAYIDGGWSAVAEHHGFEAMVAIFTLVLAIFTGTLWWVTRKILIHTPQIERAYISGGGARIFRTVEKSRAIREKFAEVTGAEPPPSKIPTGQFELHINNHGKTPGELVQISVGFCEERSIPPSPIYQVIYIHDWIGPGTQSRPIRVIDIPENLTEPAIFGRFYYNDIFGQNHKSGFILSLSTGVPIRAPQAYTDSD